MSETMLDVRDVFPDRRPGTMLAGARYREDLTQEQLSKLTRIPRRYISEMENNPAYSEGHRLEARGRPEYRLSPSLAVIHGEEDMTTESPGTRSHHDAVVETLRNDPDLTAEYIRTSLVDNADCPEAIRLALRHVAEAWGVQDVADEL